MADSTAPEPPYRLFHLDLVDLDAEQLVFEVLVEVEAVSVLHVFPPGVLVEDTGLSTCQRLERTLQLPLLCHKDNKHHVNSKN